MMPATIVLIEDERAIGKVLCQLLERHFPTSDLLYGVSLAELGIFAQGSIDLLVLDLRLPDSQDMQTLQRARALLPTIPIVVLSGYFTVLDGMMALQQGADDFVLKSSPDFYAHLPLALAKAWARHLGRQSRAFGALPPS